MQGSVGCRRRNTSMGPALSCNPARKKRKKSIPPALSVGTRCLRKNIAHKNRNICTADCVGTKLIDVEWATEPNEQRTIYILDTVQDTQNFSRKPKT